MPEVRGTLHAAFGLSERAHAHLRRIDIGKVRAAPGVVDVMMASDIPGTNDFGAAVTDDPILAQTIVQCVGQPLFIVAALTVEQARRAARLAVVEYEELPAIITIDDALAQRSFVLPSVTVERGEWRHALQCAPERLKGSLRTGGQEHFYLEGQIAYAQPRESGDMMVYSSTQHPGEVQLKVARTLAVDAHRIVVECRRMGGGFGGKESQATLIACAAALMAQRLRQPVKLRLDRDDDFMITGKRHDFLIEYEVGFQPSGQIVALDLMLASRCGYSTDLSRAVNDRAVTHADGCYFLENVRIVSHRCKTHTQSNTAFRGFGAPQGMIAIEQVVEDIAQHLGRDPLEVRRKNFYQLAPRDTTHYEMQIEDFIADQLSAELACSSRYSDRREAIRAWNVTSPIIKRGIALVPVKHGIAYSALAMNQAGAMVHVYTDGSVLVNHGGTEMGQGLFTKVAQIVATELGVDLDKVRVSAADTSKIPNASPTSASSGTDLNGKAAQAAARAVKDGMEEVRFSQGKVSIGSECISFRKLVTDAYNARVQLWASGFYKTPKIHFDREKFRGRPYLYFAYGAAVTEVAVDTLTGELKIIRVDVLHDVGRSVNPALDIGQIEGGFVQGAGWLTTEELCWDGKGRLTTHAPSTYKIPVASDVPAHFDVKLWERGINVEDSIHRSKAVGESPLMLAISVFCATRDAVAAVGTYRLLPRLNAPTTPQEILNAIRSVKSSMQSTNAR